MAEKVTFNVLRRHEGDKLYEENDTREMTEAEARQLVGLGVLERADVPAKNKAEPASPNKADPLDHDKNGRKGGSVKAKG